MTDIGKAGTYRLGDRTVKRLGYGAMQLAGPGVFGPPKDRDGAIAVLREAVAAGVDHIDTSDYYGPHVTNQLIREALHPYPDDLVIVTKIGARRGADGSWLPASRPSELTQAVHDNLRNLGLDVLDVVNLRIMGDVHGPAEGLARGAAHRPGRAPAAGARSPYRPQQRHADAGRGGPRHRPDRLRAEPLQPRASRRRRADRRAGRATASPTCRSSRSAASRPLQSTALSEVAARLGATPMQVALAWLLQRAPNILLIPGTSSVGHLRENLAAADVQLPQGGHHGARPDRDERCAGLRPLVSTEATGPLATGASGRMPMARAKHRVAAGALCCRQSADLHPRSAVGPFISPFASQRLDDGCASGMSVGGPSDSRPLAGR